MKIVVERQCDAHLEEGRKALFPGQHYDLPAEVIQPLIVSGHVRAYRTADTAFVASPDSVRATGRPRAGKKD
jgi:hypothetical protein